MLIYRVFAEAGQAHTPRVVGVFHLNRRNLKGTAAHTLPSAFLTRSAALSNGTVNGIPATGRHPSRREWSSQGQQAQVPSAVAPAASDVGPEPSLRRILITQQTAQDPIGGGRRMVPCCPGQEQRIPTRLWVTGIISPTHR